MHQRNELTSDGMVSSPHKFDAGPMLFFFLSVLYFILANGRKTPSSERQNTNFFLQLGGGEKKLPVMYISRQFERKFYQFKSIIINAHQRFRLLIPTQVMSWLCKCLHSMCKWAYKYISFLKVSLTVLFSDLKIKPMNKQTLIL